MAERADVVILGGGLAGLSLAERLARRRIGRRVLVIEPRTDYVDDRSWAFWTPTTSRWASAAAMRWTHWRFGVRGRVDVTAAAPGWCYAMIRSLSFYDDARAAIAANPQVTLALGVRAEALRSQADGVVVETSAGPMLARHVIDTRPPDARCIAASTLLQSFHGREIAFDEPADASVADVMTDMRCDDNGFVFAYVLPLSPRRALVEITRFAPVAYGASALAADLDALLAQRGWSNARTLREEGAVLPMGLPDAAPDVDRTGVVRGGTAAGALRAASGYGFLRIQAWADRCADAIANGEPPIGHPPEPRLRRWMDAVFLHALAAHPARAPEFFLRLADRLPPAALVRFLSDRARLGDVLRVVAALPPGPFVRALPAGALARRRSA